MYKKFKSHFKSKNRYELGNLFGYKYFIGVKINVGWIICLTANKIRHICTKKIISCGSHCVFMLNNDKKTSVMTKFDRLDIVRM